MNAAHLVIKTIPLPYMLCFFIGILVNYFILFTTEKRANREETPDVTVLCNFNAKCISQNVSFYGIFWC